MLYKISKSLKHLSIDFINRLLHVGCFNLIIANSLSYLSIAGEQNKTLLSSK